MMPSRAEPPCSSRHPEDLALVGRAHGLDADAEARLVEALAPEREVRAAEAVQVVGVVPVVAAAEGLLVARRRCCGSTGPRSGR